MLLLMKDNSAETMWPRDTLFEYLQTMEKLQENMQEYQELQHIAACALFEIAESR